MPSEVLDAPTVKPTAPSPAPPVRQFSFTDFQTNNPTSPPPGDRLDAEFDRANKAITDTITWAGTSLNTDGTLRDGIVDEGALVPGLFDNVADDAMAEVQPLVDQAHAYSNSAGASASAASGSASTAATQASAAAASASTASTAATNAQASATNASGSATNAGTSATNASNSANTATGARNAANDYAVAAQAWAEWMPDNIPPNILAVMGISGSHWSARWWAQNAATVGDSRYLQIAGGTMTGALTLAGDPSVGLQAATKQYVDNKAAAYLPLAGGTLTGALLLRNSTPSVALEAASKGYVDGQIGTLTASAAATYAPIASPAFTGTPTAPTATAGTSSTQLATTAFVMNAVSAATAGVASFNTRTGAVTLLLADITGAGGAPIASPTFTGTVTAAAATVTGLFQCAATVTMNQAVNIGQGTTSSGSLTMNAQATAQRPIRWNTNGVQRWQLGITSAAEAGSNAGADWQLLAFNDAGAQIFTALVATRSTGLITVAGDPTANLGIATKQYVDGKSVSPYTSNPNMDGTANAGSSALYARGDHVHPTDTTLAPLNAPSFTGGITVAGNSIFNGTATFVSTPNIVQQTLNIGTNTNSAGILALNGQATALRPLRWNTASVQRWQWAMSSGAESGSNAGADLVLTSYDDTGVLLFTPLTFTRATGAATFGSGAAVTIGTSGTHNAITLTPGVTPGTNINITGSGSGSVLLGPNSGAGFNTSTTTAFQINGAAGNPRVLQWSTAGVSRWRLNANATAEGGSNAGSDLALQAMSDAGTLLFTPLTVTRSTGAITAATQVSVNDTSGANSSVAAMRIQNTGTPTYNMSFLPRSNAGANAGIVQAGDSALIFSQNAVDTGALVIAPWNSQSYGMRFTAAGAWTGKWASANLTIPATTFSGSITAGLTVAAQNGRFVSSSSGSNPGFTVYDTGQGLATVMFMGGSGVLYWGAADSSGAYTGTPYMYLNRSGSLTCQGTVQGSLGVYGNAGGTLILYENTNHRYVQMTTGWYWDFDGGTGNMIWVTPGGSVWNMRSSDWATFNGVAWVGGVGAYQNISDTRTKADIAPSDAGLNEILALEPIAFNRVRQDGKVDPVRELGFSAQNVLRAIPEAVREMAIKHPAIGKDDPPSLSVADTPIVAALVRAVHQLYARILTLEGALPA